MDSNSPFFLFKEESQWKSGLLQSLQFRQNQGLTLFAIPTFSHWIEDFYLESASGVEIDSCGLLYVLDRSNRTLYKFDSNTSRVYPVCQFSEGIAFGYRSRIFVDKFTIWLWNFRAGRIYAISRENGQIKSEIYRDSWRIIDVSFSPSGFLYCLVRVHDCIRIIQFDEDGRLIHSIDAELKDPIFFSAQTEDLFYVVDYVSDQPPRWGLVQLDRDGKQKDAVCFDLNFRPYLMSINSRNAIYIYDAFSRQIVEFDPDGNEIGPLPGLKGYFVALKAAEDKIYAIDQHRIASYEFKTSSGTTGGVYFTATLDSGITNCRWHRVAFESDLPAGTVLEVGYCASDDRYLKDQVNTLIASNNKSTAAKAKELNDLFKWEKSKFEIFASDQSSLAKNPDLLFLNTTGRYLWVCLKLFSYSKDSLPIISSMRITYPRDSYLRFLPAIYQEDPNSKEFLERFLSMFESVFTDLESEINKILYELDPSSSRKQFLPWLGSWLNLTLQEDWKVEQKRNFIREAPSLYKQKGTVQGIKRLIRILTGKTPMILEHSKAMGPIVLRDRESSYSLALGINTVVWRTPVRNFRLGDDSILGYSTIKDPELSPEFAPEDPFAPLAHHFTLVLNLSREEFRNQKAILTRFLDQMKPAHTVYQLRLSEEMRLGVDTYVEITSQISGPASITIGVQSIIGAGVVVTQGEQAGRIEKSSWLGKDLRLV